MSQRKYFVRNPDWPFALSRSRRSIVTGGFILNALFFCTIAFAGLSEDIARYHDDVDFLSGKVAHYKDTLQVSEENAQRMAKLDTVLVKLREKVSQLNSFGSDFEQKEMRLRMLRDNDLEPKAREVERTRQYAQQRFADAERERQYFMQEVQAHNAKSNIFTLPDQGAALSAYNQEKIDLNTRGTLIWSSTESSINEAQAMVQMAMQSFTFAQQEFQTAELEHRQIAAKLNETSEAYDQDRTTLVGQLIALEKESIAAGTHPLQDAAKAKSIETDLLQRKPQPIDIEGTESENGSPAPMDSKSKSRVKADTPKSESTESLLQNNPATP